MKYLICLSLLFLTSCLPAPQHKVGEIIHIKSGFYQGCCGVITEYRSGTCSLLNNGQYTMQDVICPNHVQINLTWICADELE